MSTPPPWDPIATRRLSVTGHPRGRVVVEIGRPWQVDPHEWRCPYRIRGTGFPRTAPIRHACGADAIQALLLSFVAIRAELDSADPPLSWLSDEPGDVGLPALAPGYYGFAFQRTVERGMERAVLAEAKRLGSGLRRG